jgi:hypothetical protein
MQFELCEQLKTISFFDCLSKNYFALPLSNARKILFSNFKLGTYNS